MAHTVLRHPVADAKGGLVSRPWARWVDDVTRAALGGSPVTLSTTGTITVDWARGLLQWLTLEASAVITFSGLTDGAQAVLLLEQGVAGSAVPTWPGDVRWPADTEPTWSSSAGVVDVVHLLRVDGLGTAGVTLAWADLGFVP